MNTKGTLEEDSGWKGTSYNKLLGYLHELLDSAGLKHYEIEMYEVPILLDQDYQHNKFENEDGQIQYRYHDYDDLNDSDCEQEINTKAQGGYCMNGCCGHCKREKIITEEFIMTYEFGDKSNPTLVLVHGYLSNAMIYHQCLKYLEDHYHVILIDLLGLGASSRPKFLGTTSNDALDFFIQSFEKWRTKMNITQFYLAGYSMSGYLMSKYTLAYPQHVKKLVLISPLGMEPAKGDPKDLLVRTYKVSGIVSCCFWNALKLANKTKFNQVNLFRGVGSGIYNIFHKIHLKKVLKNVSDKQADLVIKYMAQTMLTKESSEVGISYLLDYYLLAKNPILHDLNTFESHGIDFGMIYGSDTDFLNTDFENTGKPISYRLVDMGYKSYTLEDSDHNIPPIVPEELVDIMHTFLSDSSEVKYKQFD